MSEHIYTLTLSLTDNRGFSVVKAMDLEPSIAREVVVINPPCPFSDTFDSVIQLMKRREFRKDLFRSSCTRMGAKLVEYMEDKEGWHGVDRQEKTA